MTSRRIDGEVALIGLVALFGGLMFWQSLSLPAGATRLPRLISLFVLVLSIYRLAGLLLPRGRPGPPAGAGAGETGMFWLTSAVLMLAYWAATYVLGFLLSTLIYAAVLPWLLGYRRILLITAIALVVAFGLTASMQWLFKLPVPGGIIFG